MSERATFAAMGCEVVVCGASPAALRSIRALFTERERVFSRFRADSELSRVNASGERLVRVSPLFAATLRRALVAYRLSGGLVDPTLGTALADAGYDRDFAALAETGWPAGGHLAAVGPDAAPGRAAAAPGSRLHELRLAGRLLSRPEGLVLDLNGVVKALAVDDALTLIDRPGLVSAGGDLAVRGSAVVALPAGSLAGDRGDPPPVAPVVRLDRGALATSGTSTRRWLQGGVLRHHLIDPATGLPAATPWECVTVAAGTCHHADVAAKAAFLAGAAGPAWLAARGLPGRFVRPDGTVLETAAWRTAVGRAPELTPAVVTATPTVGGPSCS